MSLRDRIETLLRSWNAYEVARGAPPVVDFDCHPPDYPVPPARDRVAVAEALEALRIEAASSEDGALTVRLGAHLAYIHSLLGDRPGIREYIEVTQGCRAVGWPDEYIHAHAEQLRKHLDDMGIGWGPNTDTDLRDGEGALDVADAGDAIRAAATELEPDVRELTGSDATYDLSIENVNVDAYWAYWLDGLGPKVRLRINLRHARFTTVQARQFALHEVLGHGLQCASFSQTANATNVPWVRVTSVHSQQQTLLEGLATAFPMFITPGDPRLTTRARLAHYTHLVLAKLHLAINEGMSARDCIAVGRNWMPFWSDERIGDALSDRSVNPLLRSYMWSYSAGTDWFMHLSQASPEAISKVFRAAYRAPLTPSELTDLWPDGPGFGGISSDR